MNRFLQKIRLRYAKIEIYTLFFLAPVAVYLFLLLLSFAQNSKIAKLDYNRSERRIFASLVEKQMNSPIECLDYEYKNSKIFFVHYFSNKYLSAEKGLVPFVKKIAKNSFVIEENYITDSNLSTHLSKFSFNLKKIDINKQLKIVIIKHIKGLTPQKIFISLDLSQLKKNRIILEDKPIILQNIKSFFDKDIARL